MSSACPFQDSCRLFTSLSKEKHLLDQMRSSTKVTLKRIKTKSMLGLPKRQSYPHPGIMRSVSDSVLPPVTFGGPRTTISRAYRTFRDIANYRLSSFNTHRSSATSPQTPVFLVKHHQVPWQTGRRTSLHVPGRSIQIFPVTTGPRTLRCTIIRTMSTAATAIIWARMCQAIQPLNRPRRLGASQSRLSSSRRSISLLQTQSKAISARPLPTPHQCKRSSAD